VSSRRQPAEAQVGQSCAMVGELDIHFDAHRLPHEQREMRGLHLQAPRQGEHVITESTVALGSQLRGHVPIGATATGACLHHHPVAVPPADLQERRDGPARNRQGEHGLVCPQLRRRLTNIRHAEDLHPRNQLEIGLPKIRQAILVVSRQDVHPQQPVVLCEHRQPGLAEHACPLGFAGRTDAGHARSLPREDPLQVLRHAGWILAGDSYLHQPPRHGQ
jgi:hypothetical protein